MPSLSLAAARQKRRQLSARHAHYGQGGQVQATKAKIHTTGCVRCACT
jgi:hypothetical protein